MNKVRVVFHVETIDGARLSEPMSLDVEGFEKSLVYEAAVAQAFKEPDTAKKILALGPPPKADAAEIFMEAGAVVARMAMMIAREKQSPG